MKETDFFFFSGSLRMSKLPVKEMFSNGYESKRLAFSFFPVFFFSHTSKYEYFVLNLCLLICA